MAANVRDYTREDLAKYFHLPINGAAREIGVCATVLKKICRKNGIPRWPHRKIKSINKMIETLQQSLKKGNHEDDERIQKEIKTLQEHKEYVMKNPGVLVKKPNAKERKRKREQAPSLAISQPPNGYVNDPNKKPRLERPEMFPINNGSPTDHTTPIVLPTPRTTAVTIITNNNAGAGTMSANPYENYFPYTIPPPLNSNAKNEFSTSSGKIEVSNLISESNYETSDFSSNGKIEVSVLTNDETNGKLESDDHAPANGKSDTSNLTIELSRALAQARNTADNPNGTTELPKSDLNKSCDKNSTIVDLNTESDSYHNVTQSQKGNGEEHLDSKSNRAAIPLDNDCELGSSDIGTPIEPRIVLYPVPLNRKSYSKLPRPSFTRIFENLPLPEWYPIAKTHAFDLQRNTGLL